MTKRLLAVTLGLLLGGCSLAPDYQRPATPAGATWQAGGEDRAPNMAQIRQVQFNEDGTYEFVVIEDFFELPDTRPAAE